MHCILRALQHSIYLHNSLSDVIDDSLVGDVVADVRARSIRAYLVLQRHEQDLSEMMDEMSHITQCHSRLLHTARLWRGVEGDMSGLHWGGGGGGLDLVLLPLGSGRFLL